MPDLNVYGASDDLVEFDGVVTAEYNVYEPARFLVTARSGPGRARQLLINTDFGNEGWEIYAGTATDIGADSWTIRTTRQGRNDDPKLVITVASGEAVKIRKLSND